MIEFRLSQRSGVPTYLQLVQQVRQAVRLGLLGPGDQLPTVKEVVGRLAINPNTVLKAYRELDREGLVEARRGQGTFVAAGLSRRSRRTPSCRRRWWQRSGTPGRPASTRSDLAAAFAAAVERVYAGGAR